MMRQFHKISALIASLAISSGILSAQCISLDGEWTATLDSIGSYTVNLPGTLDMAAAGIPSTLKPAMEKPQLFRLTRKRSYIGPCTYSRIIEIPEKMAGKPLRLSMERVLWKSRVCIDGKPVKGENITLNSPHVFELPPLTQGPHLIEITIDNRLQRDISFSNLCHSYTDDTQTVWNGVLGNFTLCAIPQIDLGSPEIYPDIKEGNIEVRIPVSNRSGRDRKTDITLTVTEKNGGKVVARKKAKYRVPVGNSDFGTVLNIENPKLWSEFSPELYRLEVEADGSARTADFGMREVKSQGKSLYVNGKKTFLRGTLDCCVFPLTGVPPTDKAGWLKEMETLKQWGFNHIRFHSWCPPEAAFELADSLGIYLQTELPVWSLKIGEDPKVNEFLRDEFINMSENYGNHPSWIMSTCGNELQKDFSVLNNLVRQMKEADPRHLYAATSFTFEKGHGGHAEPFDDFLITQWTDDGWVRGQGVFDNELPAFDRNYNNSMECVSVPLVSHEIGQYAVYPDLAEIEKYTGVLDPLNFKAIRNDLQKKGLLEKADDYLKSTVSFAELLYKEEIERALKTPGFSGYQLLGIQDFPGQGTALVGLLNSFWDAKASMSGERFRRFNAPAVPLASFPKAVYSTDENFIAKVLVSNFSDAVLSGRDIRWTLAAENGHSASGIIQSPLIPQGEVSEAALIEIPLGGFASPAKLTLNLRLEGTDYENEWNIWVYTHAGDTVAGNVTVTSDLREARTALDNGRTVLYLPEQDKVIGIESKFLPVFWSPVHFPKQAGGMGVIADAAHPSLKGFPNDGHSDWQWWRPVKNARVMLLDSIVDENTGQHIEPIVGVVDNFYKNRRLGYIFETKCGNGRIFVSSINLNADGPEMRSLRNGILRYLNSEEFNPANEVTFETIESITGSDTINETTNATSIYQ